MTAFLAGALFGGLFAGAVFALFVTRVQRPREIEQWEDPFFEPAPVEIKTTTRKRHYSL